MITGLEADTYGKQGDGLLRLPKFLRAIICMQGNLLDPFLKRYAKNEGMMKKVGNGNCDESL